MNDSTAWYLAEQGQQSGPHSKADLIARIRAETLGRGTPAWREGMGDWAPIDTLDEFVAEFAGTPPCRAHSYASPGAGMAPVSGDSTSVLLAVFSYVGVLLNLPWALFAIVPLVMRREEFSLYHAKQAITLLIVSFVSMIICIPFVFMFIGIAMIFAVFITTIVLAIIGIVNAAQGKQVPLPLVGSIAESWFAGVRVESAPVSHR
jgi:uncharacterized membrane protein